MRILAAQSPRGVTQSIARLAKPVMLTLLLAESLELAADILARGPWAFALFRAADPFAIGITRPALALLFARPLRWFTAGLIAGHGAGLAIFTTRLASPPGAGAGLIARLREALLFAILARWIGLTGGCGILARSRLSAGLTVGFRSRLLAGFIA